MGPDADPGGCLGSCWLEPCDNPISQNQWRRMQRNILHLREHTQNNIGRHIELPFMYRASQAVPYLLSMQVGAEFDSDTEVRQALYRYSVTDNFWRYYARLRIPFPYLITMGTVLSLQPSPTSDLVNQ